MPQHQTQPWYSIQRGNYSAELVLNKKGRLVPSAAAPRAETEILIYGDIGDAWWIDEESVTAAALVRELAGLPATEPLSVRINSYGGSVKDGLAIHNALKRHRGDVTVEIDGVAVSIASLIAVAGDTVRMADNALFMVHAPWTAMLGGFNAVDLREQADTLDTYARAMSSSYAVQTGQDADEILTLLADGKDHWYTAAEALAAGFIDEIAEAASEADLAAAARFDLSRFHPPLQIAAALRPMEVSDMPDQAEKLTPGAAPAAPIQPPATGPEPAHTPPPAEGPAPAAASVDRAAVEAEVFAREQARRAEVRAVFDPFLSRTGMQSVLDRCLDDPRCAVASAREHLLAKLGEGAGPLAGDLTGAGPGLILPGEDARDKFRAGVRAALSARGGLAADDAANNYRGHSLLEMARASLEMSGQRTGHLGRMEVVGLAFTHGDADFTNILADVAHKSVLKGWEEAEETFERWTVRGELSDFKPTKRVDLNTFPALDDVTDTEYKYGTFGDRGETIVLASYGKLFGIRRKAIINDDLGVFTRVPMKMGRAARRTVGNLVYAVLTSNPTMADGVVLFHASHSNLPTGAAISTAAVDAMRVAMATQQDPAGHATGGLNINLAYLLVPRALEGLAKSTAESEYEVAFDSNGDPVGNRIPNSVRGTYEVISDARLDTDSAAVWYGAGNPAMHDTVEVAYLDGNAEPFTDQEDGWTVDGSNFKVRIDAGVKALDFRALAKNAGP